MADEEQVRILKEEGVDAWNKYAKEKLVENPNWYANLSEARLGSTSLSNAYLSDAYLSGADLSRTNLSGVNLSRANLSRANLLGASLGSANLSSTNLIRTKLNRALLLGTNLIRANLSDANLSGADLSRTNLSGAVLSHADLSRSKLFGAKLSHAYLNHADLSGAELMMTTFGDLDLSKVYGLERVQHSGPSTVGIDTLYKSKGKIPDVFLRGCGVPDEFITYARSLVHMPIDFYSCFISYSHADKSFARRLHDQLQGRGIRCWLDEHELLPGDPVQDQIDRGIRLWDKVLVCCSEASLGFSAWVDIEVEKAMQKEAKLQKERGERVHALIPLNLDNYLFDTWDSGAASVLKGRLAADFRGWETDNAKFEQQFEKVVKALQTGDTGREAPPTPKL